MQMIAVTKPETLKDREPTCALVGEVDLIVVRFDDGIAVLYGRCLHRGAMMADGHVKDDNLFCGVHGWDYRLDSGVSAYNNAKAKQQLDELNRSVDALEESMASAKDDAKARYPLELKKMREQSRAAAAAAAKLDELKAATESQWDKLVSEAEKLRDALKHSYNYSHVQLMHSCCGRRSAVAGR